MISVLNKWERIGLYVQSDKFVNRIYHVGHIKNYVQRVSQLSSR
jgi:hypothetical protein